MYTIDELLSLTEENITSLPLSSEPHLLYEPIRYGMQEGGKRVRPVLMLLTANLFTDNISPFVPTAVALEMFHNFTLLHDDIMDNSEKRRGRDTVHRRWGTNVAILSGDAMLIYAYKLMLTTAGEKALEVMNVFNKLSLELCEGQQIDMDFESTLEVSLTEYLNMIRLKTSVLIAGAMQIGAIMGGASSEDATKAYSLGINIGTAFQIQDDILDLYAECPSFGKPIGGDIIEGKKSYLYLLCYEHASESDKLTLRELYNNTELAAQSKIEAVRSLFDKYDIRTKAEEAVRRYTLVAQESLEAITVSPERKKTLREYAIALISRVK